MSIFVDEFGNERAVLDSNGKPTLIALNPENKIKNVRVDQDGNLLISGSGGGGDISVLSENVLVNNKTTKINFLGSGIKAIQSPIDVSQVNVYAPPNLYSSYFNDNSGTSPSLVNNITTTNRYIASPTSEGVPFKIGTWVGGELHTAISASSISYQPVNPCSILDNTSTTFTAIMYDADGVSILSQNQVTLIGNSDTTVSGVRIQVTGFTTELGKYIANIVTTFNLPTILPNGGRFSVKMEHNNGADGVFSKTQNDIFYDANLNNPLIDSINISETAGQVVTKSLSGVNYYTIGSKFTVNIPDIDWLNDSTYPSTQVEITGTTYGLPNINLQGSGLIGWTNSFNNINSNYTNTGWGISSSNTYQELTTALVSTRSIDWSPSSWLNSATSNILLDTFSENSTRIYEDFRTETNRLLSDCTTTWTNTQSLLTIDGGIGLQCNNTRLKYPLVNYSIYNPTPGTQPDYSASTGTKYYYRKFYHPTIDYSNGVFTFSGHNLTEAALAAGDFNIKISTDKTNWYQLNSDYLGGVLINGAGCRINSDTNTLTLNNKIEFTLSSFFTKEVFIEISYADTVTGKALYLDSISLNWA